MGQHALAHYDENPVLELEAVSGLQALFPDDDRLLALRLQERKAYAEAAHQAQRASKTDPYNPYSWQTGAAILQLQGQIDQARESFKTALRLNINCEYAARQLLLLADSVIEKLDALSSIKQQIEQQTTAGSAINVYREIAFPITGRQWIG